MTSGLSLESLKKAVAGEIVAYRSVMDMDPAGGPGDKIFPPTYAVGDREPAAAGVTDEQIAVIGPGRAGAIDGHGAR